MGDTEAGLHIDCAAAVSIHPLEGDKSAVTAPVVAEHVDPVLT